MAGDSEIERTESDAAEWSNEAPPAEARRSFFTFWRCCGCLAFVGVALFLAVGVGAKWVRDNAFESVPMEIPEMVISSENADRIAERLEREIGAGELVRITPEELTVVIQYGLSKAPAFGPETRFHAGATPENLLDLRLRLHWDAENEDVPWFMRGRYSNVSMVGNLTIEDGEIVEALLTSYRFGGFREGVDQTEEQSKQLLEGLRQQSDVNPDLRRTVESVKLFRFDGEKIELQLEKP